MQRVQDGRRERENYFISTMKTCLFIWVMSLYIYVEETITSFSNSFKCLDQAHPLIGRPGQALSHIHMSMFYSSYMVSA